MNQLVLIGPEAVADTNDDWYTPTWLFDMAGLRFDLDVCAPIDPQRRTCPADGYLTVVEDGLTAPWHGLVWMNPPWSHSRPWVQRFATHPDGLALLPATRSARTHELLSCADMVCFLDGQFKRPDGRTDHTPWLLMIAARGQQASGGLQSIAQRWGTVAWARTEAA